MKSKYLHVKSCKYLLYKQLERKVRILFHWINGCETETPVVRKFHLHITVHSLTCNIASVPCRNGRYKSPPPNSRMPIPVSVSSGKPYRNSSSNTIPSLPKKMGYSRAKVTFQRYYSDVKNLTTDNLQTFFEGNLWIITRRKKTNTESNIRLLNVPQKIKPPNYTQKLPLRCHLTTLKRNTDEKKKEYNHDRRVR